MCKRATFQIGVTGFLFTLFCFSLPAGAEPVPSKSQPASRSGSSEKENSPSTGKSTTAEKTPRRTPLPDYYGQLGISDKQRLDLQKVQTSYDERLDRLRDELKALTNERDEKLENLLTEGQRLRLKELQVAAREKMKAKKAAEKK